MAETRTQEAPRNRSTQAASAVADKPQGPVSLSLGLASRFIMFLFMTLLLAIVIEWIGMFWWWSDEGVHHARRMMERETSFLSEDFQQSLLASHPAVFARWFADNFYYWGFEWTGVASGIRFLATQPPYDAGQGRLFSHQLYLVLEPFVVSAVLMTQTFALRLAVLILASPVFVLFAAVGFADGLMRRDLRRWGGGRESSVAHGAARAFIIPLIMAPWMIYLALPFSLHPNFIILPCAVALGVAICVTSATFKKYL